MVRGTQNHVGHFFCIWMPLLHFLGCIPENGLAPKDGAFSSFRPLGRSAFECSVFYYDKEFGTTACTSHDKSFEAPSYVCTFYVQRILPKFSMFLKKEKVDRKGKRD